MSDIIWSIMYVNSCKLERLMVCYSQQQKITVMERDTIQRLYYMVKDKYWLNTGSRIHYSIFTSNITRENKA